MKENRQVYKIDDLEHFMGQTYKYFALPYKTRNMNNYCAYMGITRFTLSKYRQRNKNWNRFIFRVKMYIKILKALDLKSLQDIEEYSIIELADYKYEIETDQRKTDNEYYGSEFDYDYDYY